MEVRITEKHIQDLTVAWYRCHGERLSATKAIKRLKAAVAKGCQLLDDCTKCALVRSCPVLADES